ncbi:hypothetical protein [Aquimarina sp. AU474]|uniref:hypothetical protein n=1 Tax=Aquimarina sp. AU474 TaxID=2108529 RepID=UPI001F1D3B9E|nr:hypothetical protein [Aquimarina sp. AU474]
MIKLKPIFTVIILLTIVSCSNESYELFDIGKIDANSELFSSLRDFSESKSEEDPVCLTFIYPFNVYVYDDQSEIIDSKIIRNNIEFIAALDATQEDGAIGLSYPISSVQENGTTLSINNNNELKTAIEVCIKSEIITYCNGLLEEVNCIWKITSSTENTRYNSSLMDFYDDGTGIFYDKGNAYRTSWVSLFIGEELHINIHIEGDSQVANDWNLNWKVITLNDDSIEIMHDDNKYTVNKRCGIPNACGYVEFRTCEKKNKEEKAVFILNNYIDCILSLQENITDSAPLSLSFFENLESAEQEINPLDASSYTNTTNPQLVFVKIKNTNSNEFNIIRIVLFVEACDSDDGR